jgi:hypothetical protein
MNMAEHKMSVVLATDTYASIRPVIERFRKQTVRDQLEIVFVTPSAQELKPALAYREEFGGMKIVENSVDDLADARAAGVRGATGSYVFIGETHSYPHPRMCEILLQHAGAQWAILMPAMDNANPKSVFSWASFLSDYGRWVDGLPVGVTASVPIYNAAFRRDTLLALGDRLATSIGRGEDLAHAFALAGHQVYFEPAALIDHLNVAPFGHWALQRFVLGMMIGGNRSQDWSLGRRALYFLASPLIPIVLWRRLAPGVRSSFRLKRWPVSIFFWITLGLIVKTWGEAAAYAGFSAKASSKQNHEYELHKLAYSGLNEI